MLKNKLADMQKDGEENGFTLIELMVVVLIIGILMAIAIPTFLSLTSSAKTNSAEANITTAVQDAATYFTNNANYGGTTAAADVAALKTIDTGSNFVAGTPPVGSVGVTEVSSTEVILESLGADGAYYWADINNGVVTYAKSLTSTQPATPFTYTSWNALNAA